MKLEDIAEVIEGQSPKSEFYNSEGLGIPFFQGKADFGEKYPSVSTWCIKPTKIAHEGDILFSVRAPVGPTNIANERCCIGRGLAAIRVGAEIDRSYLRYYFSKVEQKISDSGRGSTFNSITQKDLKNLKIPLPSLSEQRAIVAKLDRAQRLIDIDRQMLAKYDALIQSVFLDMFGDPVRNEKGWEVRKLGDVGKVQTGKTPSTKVPEFFIGDIPFVTPSDLGKREISPTRFLSNEGLGYSKSVRKGATMVCCIGATIGKVGIATETSGFNQQINTIEWKRGAVTDEYGYIALKLLENEIKRNAKSTTLPILKKSKFQEILVPVPDIKSQKHFTEIFKKIDSEIKSAEQFMQKSESLFLSLVQQAFSKT
ncbi:restriction endonuclease subunit S [Cyclonatronum proteinivorum]|uniref:restriction endonuclease subunit S n=1 Tax=Cyclonatronum proteinivorum TaxID=1457365 RepID=UPI000F5248D8|nr:restriction endonuclease subunit S [Cyclonatronum proteinivorum]